MSQATRPLIVVRRDSIGLFGRVMVAERWEPVPWRACFGNRDEAPAHVRQAAGTGQWTIDSRQRQGEGEPRQWYVQVSRHDINAWDLAPVKDWPILPIGGLLIESINLMRLCDDCGAEVEFVGDSLCRMCMPYRKASP